VRLASVSAATRTSRHVEQQQVTEPRSQRQQRALA